MSVLLFAFETRPGGFAVFIGMEHSLSMSSKDACVLGFMDFVVTNNHFPLVSDRTIGSNPLIDPIFLDSVCFHCT